MRGDPSNWSLGVDGSGGEFLAPAVLNPAACPPSVAFAAPWLKLKDQSKLQFVAEPNTTTATRETSIMIGDRSIVVRQLHPPQPGLGVAPSRLVFAVDKDGRSERKISPPGRSSLQKSLPFELRIPGCWSHRRRTTRICKSMRSRFRPSRA